uniref:(northern house mosquito) hypothetical protein n=1 Tax=Culex pipiens TaxID=7175 RepID=A0A8D8BNK2_CULPI
MHLPVRMEGRAVRRVRTVPGLHARNLQEAVGVPVQRRLGRFVLQPGLELLHQPQTVPERWNLLQHGPGLVHVQVSAGLYRHRVRNGHQRLRGHAMPQQRSVSRREAGRLPVRLSQRLDRSSL